MINGLIKWWKEFHMCSYIEISSEYKHQTMFKKLYEVNGWSKRYTLKTYKCKKCGDIRTETSSSNGIS